MLISRGEPYTNEDQKRVWSAINTIARMPEQWHLSGIRTQLPPHLAERLNMWVGNGQYGAIFDNAVETFTMSDMTGLEMGYLMQNHAIAAGLLMDYVFYLLDLKFDGSRPGLVNIQEFWFMLQNEKFAQRLDNWSRTMRKRNVVVMLSTQSLQEMNDSPYQMSFIDNFPNKVFLPNQQAWAHERIYKSMFGLTDHQIGQIVNSIPQRNYYLVTPTLSRMLEISMPKELLAYLRGDGKAQNVFMRHQNSGKEGWRDDYIAEMLRS